MKYLKYFERISIVKKLDYSSKNLTELPELPGKLELLD